MRLVCLSEKQKEKGARELSSLFWHKGFKAKLVNLNQ
jgi:hypothetical protein